MCCIRPCWIAATPTGRIAVADDMGADRRSVSVAAVFGRGGDVEYPDVVADSEAESGSHRVAVDLANVVGKSVSRSQRLPNECREELNRCVEAPSRDLGVHRGVLGC